jgi:hypothetical protein
MQQAQTIIMALEDARATNQNIYMLAVDFSSAFMLDQDKLLQIMFDLGFPTDAVDAVRSLRRRDHERAMGTRQHPAHPDGKGQHSRLAVALLFLLTSSRCSVDPRRRAIPIRLLAHQTAPDTKSALALTTSTAHDDGLRPTRAGTKLNTFASEFSLPINGVRQSQLQTPPGRNLHRHRNAQTVARQLEGQLQIQGEHAQPIGPRDPFRYLSASP